MRINKQPIKHTTIAEGRQDGLWQVIYGDLANKDPFVVDLYSQSHRNLPSQVAFILHVRLMQVQQFMSG